MYSKKEIGENISGEKFQRNFHRKLFPVLAPFLQRKPEAFQQISSLNEIKDLFLDYLEGLEVELIEPEGLNIFKWNVSKAKKNFQINFFASQIKNFFLVEMRPPERLLYYFSPRNISWKIPNILFGAIFYQEKKLIYFSLGEKKMERKILENSFSVEQKNEIQSIVVGNRKFFCSFFIEENNPKIFFAQNSFILTEVKIL